MSTTRKLICFSRQGPEQERDAAPTVVFAVFGESLACDIGDETLDDFAARNGMVRHEKFDFAAGDAGRKAALLEWVPIEESDLLPGALETKGTSHSCAWLRFPEAVRALKIGDDRRVLQLAVQYVSAGGVDDSVIASDYTQEFLQELSSRLGAAEKSS